MFSLINMKMVANDFISDEQLETVENMAYRLFFPSLIAKNIGIPEYEFNERLKDPSDPIHKAFYKGYILQHSQLRESLIKAAHNGSNPVITSASQTAPLTVGVPASIVFSSLIKRTSRLIFEPTSFSNFSTEITSFSLTLYCFPPV